MPKTKVLTNDYTLFLEDNPQPEPVPEKGKGISPGRGKSAKYTAFVAKLAAQPGTDMVICVLPAHNKTATARARQVATGLRATLKRYHVVVTERKLDDVYKVWGRYENGTTPE